MQPFYISQVSVDFVDQARIELFAQDEETRGIDELELKVEFSSFLQDEHHTILNQLSLLIDDFEVRCCVDHSILIFTSLSQNYLVELVRILHA